ncbi:hypothetical protein [uncultured Mailhella sp.]
MALSSGTPNSPLYISTQDRPMQIKSNFFSTMSDNSGIENDAKWHRYT